MRTLVNGRANAPMWRYKLRTLMILMAIGPPLLAAAGWWLNWNQISVVVTGVLSVVAYRRASNAKRSGILWAALFWVIAHLSAFLVWLPYVLVTCFALGRKPGSDGLLLADAGMVVGGGLAAWLAGFENLRDVQRP